MNKLKTYINSTSFYILCFTIVLFINIFKIRYGSGGRDEPFYLTIPNRMLAGDVLLIHEWHPSQLTGFVMAPILKLYYFFFQTNEGIILNFRYIYLFTHSIVAIIVYRNLKNISKLGALTASLFYFLYTPFSIMTLSYNTLGLMSFLLSGLLLINENKRENFLSGIFFAIGVLCNPYMTLVFFIYSIFVISSCYYKKIDFITLKKWLYFIFGIILLTILFAGYFFFSRGSISLLIKSVHYILNDPEHLPRGFYQLLKDYSYIFYFINKKFVYIYTTIFFINIISIFFISKKVLYKNILLSINSLLLCVIFYKIWYFSLDFVNYIMFPITIVGLTFFILTKNRNSNVFVHLYLLGISYSFCMNMSSNTHVWAISTATTISVIASCIFIFDYVQKELSYSPPREKIDSIILTIIVTTILLGQGLLQLKSKINYVFDATPIKYHTELLTYGVAKNIKVTPAEKNNYDYTYGLFKEINNYTDAYSGNILYIGNSPSMWLHLENRNTIPSYSAWIGNFSRSKEISDRLRSYYKLYPNKKPNWVYITKYYMIEDYISIFDNYTQHNLSGGILLEKKEKINT